MKLIKLLILVTIMIVTKETYSQTSRFDNNSTYTYLNYLNYSTINQTINISDAYGNRVQQIQPSTNGSFDVLDNYGNRTQQIIPNSFGGYYVTDAYGNVIYNIK